MDKTSQVFISALRDLLLQSGKAFVANAATQTLWRARVKAAGAPSLRQVHASLSLHRSEVHVEVKCASRRQRCYGCVVGKIFANNRSLKTLSSAVACILLVNLSWEARRQNGVVCSYVRYAALRPHLRAEVSS